MRRTLNPPDLLRAGDVVVEDRKAARRAAVVAKAGARDDREARLGDATREVDRIVVAERGHPRDVPSIASKLPL